MKVSIPTHCTVAEAADEYGVSTQRMHQLIHQHGVVVEKLNRQMILIPRKELRKIPKDRPPGRRKNKSA